MSRLRRSVGIDIGASAVRVVEVSGLDSSSIAQITKCAIVPLPPGAVIAGQIHDINAVSWALTKALKQSKVSTYGAVLGVSSPASVVAPVVRAAALKPPEWALSMRTEDYELSPNVPLSTAALSLYPVQTDHDIERPHERTLLAAATTDAEIDKIIAVAKRAKVTPRAVDLSAAALARALTRFVPGMHSVTTFVDIGASKVTVATSEGPHMRSVYTFEGGGERISTAIRGALGGSAEEAEEAKLSMRLTSSVAEQHDMYAPAIQSLYGALPQAVSTMAPGGDAAHDAMAAAADKLIEAIAAAIETDAAKNPDRPAQRILLSGGSSMLRGLQSAIQQRIGIPAQVSKPWARVVPSKFTEAALIDADSPDPTEDPVVLLSLATAVGLAIWKDPR